MSDTFRQRAVETPERGRHNHSLYDADGNPVDMLSTDQAAAFLGISVHTLRVWRRSKDRRGPRYFKRGNLVRYRREDLRRFVDQAIVDPQRVSR